MEATIKRIYTEAKKNLQRIVLPEGAEDRVISAANTAIAEGLAEIILIGKSAEIQEKAKVLNLPHIANATIFDPAINPKQQTYVELLYNLRKDKGMTLEKAATLAMNPFYLACLMIKNGDADGEVGGAAYPTSDVLRPAFQIIKTKPGVTTVSGAMFMFTKKKEYGKNGLLIFADCAVNPMPTAKELAEIAVCTAENAKVIAQFDPRIAMLSFSSKGSAQHELVDRMVEATKLAKEMNPELLIDGELQPDAAIVPHIGQSKAPGSEIAGHANILIFPDLQSGNICYKLVQRLGDAEAIGPVLQGLLKPVNDLSRGCVASDIVKMIAITAIQAIEGKR